VEEVMKLKTNGIGLLLLGGVALASLAPAVASAGSRYARYDAPRYDAPRQYVGAPYRIYPDENRWGRSYYYEDPSTGRRDSYLSNLTACYDEPNHPPLVYMIDIRTGWVINTYARDRGRWCKVSSGLARLGGYDRGYGQLGYGGY
jgi:hypothetical protein